jgi:hypothetical protein
MELKQCPSCGTEKPVTDFGKNKQRSDGRSFYCKACSNKKARDRYSEKRLDPEWYRLEQEKERDRHLRRTFGINSEQYNQMLETQEGKCAICLTTECKSGYAFAVDHCHTTGTIRGLLCRDCNTSIGKLNDDIETLQRAIKYLRSFKK